MRWNDLAERFPPDFPAPPLLARLLEWRDAWYAARADALDANAVDLRDYLGFDLYADPAVLRRWFGEGAGYDLSRLAVFGRDREGSLLAYWFGRAGDAASAARIVLLHAEGIPDSHVVADSLEDLLGLHAPTEKDLAVGTAALRGSGDEAGRRRTLTEFRGWLIGVGIAPPRSWRQRAVIEARAERSDAAFQDWLYSEG